MGGVANAFTSILGINSQKKAMKRALAAQEAANAAALERTAPYRQAGEQATNMIQEGLSTGTLGGSFTPQNLTDDPGYQFRLAEGQKSLDRLQSARGILDSGAAIKEAQRYAQGLADQSYQDAYNRWLQEQQMNYNMLSGQQNIGYGAATGAGNMDVNMGQNRANYQIGRNQATERGIGQALGSLNSAAGQFASGFVGGFGGGVPSSGGGLLQPVSGTYGAYDPNLPWKTY